MSNEIPSDWKMPGAELCWRVWQGCIDRQPAADRGQLIRWFCATFDDMRGKWCMDADGGEAAKQRFVQRMEAR